MMVVPDGITVEKTWPLVVTFLDAAFDTTKKIDSEDAKAMCEDGRAQLWVIWAPEELAGDGKRGALVGAAITSLDCYSNGYKVLSFLAFGGTNTREWAYSALQTVEDFARAEECQAVEFKGRRGFGRVLPEYKPTAWVYTKEL